MSTRAHLTNPSYSSGHAAKDRAIHSKAVPCPSCGAEMGEPCRFPNPANGYHPVRRRMAIRALNESYTAPDVGWISTVKPSARIVLRTRAGLSRAALAEQLGLKSEPFRMWECGYAIPKGPEGAAYERWLRRALGQDVPEPAEAVL